MVNTRFAILSAVLVAVLFGTATGQGDAGSLIEQLRQELDRTDELIAHAREAVRASDNAIAAQALERAVKLQTSAWEAFQATAYRLALDLTRKAREQASLAISNSRLSEQLEGVVMERLERARDMLDRAREALPTPPGPTIATILEQARNNLVQAWEFYRQRRFRAAIKLVEQVEQAAQRLLSLARQSDQAGETYQHRLENLEQLLEYVQELLSDCGSEIGREHLEHAEEGLRMARELYAQHHPRAALMALGRAKEAARRAARQCQDSDRLQQRYQRLKGELDRVFDQPAKSTSPQVEAARELLDQANEQLMLAHKYLAENKAESAQLSLQAAQLALRQAQRYLASGR